MDEQILSLASILPDKEIYLADDVVFSGSVLKTIIRKFQKVGISVIGIVSSICTEKSYEFFNQVLPNGLVCNTILSDDVIDQICERDFYFGIAGSGIMVSTMEGYFKAPYFKPYENPNERASIPLESVDFFSSGCLDRSIALWEDAERISGRKIFVSDLPEKIIYTNVNEEVVKTLKKERFNL